MATVENKHEGPLGVVEPTKGTNLEAKGKTTDPAYGSELVVPERDLDAVLPEKDPELVNEPVNVPEEVNDSTDRPDGDADGGYKDKGDKRPGFSASLEDGESAPSAVRKFQQRLKNLRYNLETTGHVDEQTVVALNAFQEARGLSKTKTVTQKVWDEAFKNA